MADLNVSIIADKLGKDLENASESVQAEVNTAIKDLAHSAHASIVARVQSMKMSENNRRDYLRALKFITISENTYLIFLEGDWPNKLEEGFPGYNA